MNSLTLTGPDAWLAFILWSVVMFYIGWAKGQAKAAVAEAKWFAHLKAFATFMEKFPIVKLEVTEGKKDALRASESAPDISPD